ncbi:RlpA-like lipoprotein [Gluconobacter oxydans DSM 3504]|uniref:Endolytic peptidoglycan transglycosylase RlpA n=1 Tax=Gluconobacter oxydans DSM 3504 TaxID=1288313 RepID=A0A067Z2T6_GLUOY|nr:RlpA-like lipoprotein [Gluconobacter oxydans DSM 3504]
MCYLVRSEPVPSTGEEPDIVRFDLSVLRNPLRCIPLRSMTFAVALAGLASHHAAHASDDSATDGTPKTSWADSVRAALANRAHQAAHAWSQHGMASWYGRHFHGRRTASGTTFNTNDLTAAHPSLPLGTKLLVTSQDTGRSVVVTVNDRGPFNSRIIDLSHAAAAKIGMLGAGTAHVTIAKMTDIAPSMHPATEPEVAEADPSDTSAQAIQAAGTSIAPASRHGSGTHRTPHHHH